MLTKFLFLFIFLNTLGSIGHAQFREKYRGTDSTNHIKGMSFLDPAKGFVAFDYFIGFTQDSGKTFVERKVSFTNTNFNGYNANLTFGFLFNGVQAFTKDSLVAYGHFGTEPSILFSKDQGLTWKLVFHLNININAPKLSDGFTDLKIIDNVGLAVYNEGVYRTANRGQNWTFVLNTPVEALSKLSFPNASTAYVSGSRLIYKTSNGGSNWTSVSFNANAGYENFDHIFFTDANKGYVTDASTNRIYRTTNGGTSWTQMNDETMSPVYINDLYFTNDSTGYAAAGMYNVKKTTNYGKTWEYCKKNTNYQFKYYGINALFFINPKTMWAGGDGEYLMISTDLEKATLPRAYFKIDTTNLYATGKVNLVNYSKTNYQYKWYRNDTLIGNGYNASYTHNIYNSYDTLKLVVSNGVDSDTSIQTMYFYPPLILTSFTPSSGTAGSAITINGINLSNVSFVSFGGVPASYFTLVSSTKITAYVGSGASGQITVGARNGIGKLNGFSYVNVPNIDLPLTVSDSLLCKSERAIIQIQNSEADVTYDLVDSLGQNFGSANGNGGLLIFKSQSISQTGNYYLWATRNITIRKKFSNPIHFTVEHPRGVFVTNKINIVAGEPVNYFNYSIGAQKFEWKLNQDASVKSSILPALQNITYSSAGQKTLTLISTTNAGCADSSVFNGAFVYNKPIQPDVCYSNNVSDSDTYNLSGSLYDMSPTKNDAYLICGAGNNPLVKSRYGNGKQFTGIGISYIAKYTTDGTLQWAEHTTNGQIRASVTDKDGNIYVTGIINSATYFHFNNGDSMQFVVTPGEKIDYGSKMNGFVLKLDSSGNYIWHTILYDPTEKYKGYPISGGMGTSIKIQDDRIIIAGNFLAKLSYYYKGNLSPIIDMQKSTYANDNLNNFIISITRDGALQWKAYTHNNATNQLYSLAVAGFDKDGNSYFKGHYENSVDLYDARDSITVLNGFTGYWGTAHGFILKYDVNGKLLWNVHLDNNFDFRETYFNSIVIDPSGNSFVTINTNIHHSPQHFILTNSDGSTVKVGGGPGFISKINTNGKLQWMKPSKQMVGTAIALKDNKLYTMGAWNGEAVSTYKGDVYMAKHDIDGNLIRIATSIQNTNGRMFPGTLFIDSRDNMLIGGTSDIYGAEIKTFFGTTIQRNGADVFFTKLNPGFCSTDSAMEADGGLNAYVCAGDTITIGNHIFGGTASWTSVPAGFVSNKLIERVAPKDDTKYLLTVTSPSGKIVKDSVMATIIKVYADAGRDLKICLGSEDNIGSYPATPGNTYAWTSTVKGFTSDDVDPYVSTDSTDYYYLIETDEDGCKGYDTVMVKAITVKSLAGVDKAICAGTSVQIGNNDSTNRYGWTSDQQGFSSSAANPIVSPIESTHYFLTTVSSENCRAYDTVLVTVNEVPAKPIITEDTLHNLISSAALGNQWFRDTSQIISGATPRIYKPSATGFYSVRVETNGCKSSLSELYNYTLPDTIIPPVEEVTIKLSPNPAQDYIIVTFEIPNTTQITIQIMDMSGTLITTQQNVINNQRIEISKLSKGMYAMRFIDDNGKTVKTVGFVKM